MCAAGWILPDRAPRPMGDFVVMNESREAKPPRISFSASSRVPSESEKAELLKKLRSLHTG